MTGTNNSPETFQVQKEEEEKKKKEYLLIQPTTWCSGWSYWTHLWTFPNSWFALDEKHKSINEII